MPPLWYDQGKRWQATALQMRYALVLIFACSSVVARAGEQPGIRATLQPASDRKAAPEFRLLDASGKTVSLSNYAGKVVLLDFWATECGGCKVEIPWFVELHRRQRAHGLAVVGVSMDILYEDLKSAAEGWDRVNPFVRTHGVRYPILMGDDEVTRAFDIRALPATYLIDRKGRVAATYVGLVDKNDVSANVDALLRESTLR